ncbi:MAG: hypothetical protein K2K08_04855 [Paramuribaculum sp.]|nr:hypothetical protein [Paramuribaculum sp.]
MEKTKQLLDKFYRGETTADENRLIVSLLSDDDGSDKALFEALEEAQLDVSVPPNLEADIRKAIISTKHRRKITIPVWVKAGGIAAAIALLVFGWLGLSDSGEIQQSPTLIAEVRQDPVTTPKAKPKPKAEVVVTDQSKPVEAAKPKVKKDAPKVPTEEELLTAEASLRLLGEKLNEAGLKAANAAEEIQNNNSLKNILK